MEESVDFFTGILVPYVNFFVFLILLVYFARKPLSSMFAKRHEDFAAAVNAANKARTEAEEQHKRLMAQMKNLEAQLATIKADAEKEAAAETERLLNEANKIAENIANEAQNMAYTEMERAKIILNNDIVQLVRSEVAKKLAEQFPVSAQTNLIQQKLSHIQQFS